MADADEVDLIDEIRTFRDEYARRFNYDMVAMCRDLRERTAASGRQVVRLEPRRPAGWVPPTAASPPEQPAE